MKFKTLLPLSGVVLAAGVLSGEDGYENTVEMVELGTADEEPLFWKMENVSPEGRGVQSLVPIGEAGAVFILSTTELEPPFRNFYLGETSVGSFLPQAEVEVVTHDVDAPVLRTRADHAFDVNVTVSGLITREDLIAWSLPPAAAYQAASEVNLLRYSADYPESESELPNDGVITTAPDAELALEGNGDFPKNSGELTFVTSLGGNAPDRARGEEHVIVRSLRDGGVEARALDSAAVQVWPVWYGGQSGLDSSQFVNFDSSVAIPEIVAQPDSEFEREEEFVAAEGEAFFTGSPPDTTFTWRDIYPSSTIGVIVNDESKPYPWGGRWVKGSQRVFTEDASIDRFDVTVSDWGEIFNQGGRFTIWMVTHTPGIGWEVGGRYDSTGQLIQEGGWKVTVDRKKIVFRGSIQSLD